MVEIDWKEKVRQLDHEIDTTIYILPSAYWDDEDLLLVPGDREWSEAIDETMRKPLPSPEEAINILANKSSNTYYDILRAELSIALIKKRNLLEANLPPVELKEAREKGKKRGWFIPGME